MVQKQINETLHHSLFELFALESGVVDAGNFLFKHGHFTAGVGPSHQAHLQLLVYHEVGEPAEWGCEVGVVLEVESEVPFEGVSVASVSGELLDLYGLEHQQLLDSIIDLFVLEELLEFLG